MNIELYSTIIQGSSSLIFGGLAVFYSRKVYKVESDRDLKERKLENDKLGKKCLLFGYELYELQLEFRNELLEIIMLNNSTSMQLFLEETKSFIDDKEFSKLVEIQYMYTFDDSLNSPSNLDVEIIKKMNIKIASLIRKNIEIYQDLNRFFDENLPEKKQKLELIHRFSKVSINIQEWSTVTLVAYYYNSLEFLSDNFLEIGGILRGRKN